MAARPKTCDAMSKIDPTLGEAGCKRLPRHGGEHRGHLTAAQERRAAKLAAKPAAAPKVKKLTAAERRAKLAELAKAVEDGTMTAGEALSAAAKLS